MIWVLSGALSVRVEEKDFEVEDPKPKQDAACADGCVPHPASASQFNSAVGSHPRFYQMNFHINLHSKSSRRRETVPYSLALEHLPFVWTSLCRPG